MEIKAIETVYNGYRCRSRLEARWAVFFDAAGIKYEYEPEGFVLEDGTRYLPDFFLPNIRGGIYVEVKGRMTEYDQHKIDLFSKQYPILVLGEIPSEEEVKYKDYAEDGFEFYFPCVDFDGTKYDGFDSPYLFCVCPACGKIGLEFDGRGWRVCHHNSGAQCERIMQNHTFVDIDGKVKNIRYPEYIGWRTDDKGYSASFFQFAYNKARQARFEHGERG